MPAPGKKHPHIATFANVITLVGLLGTIIGLIKGFHGRGPGEPG